MNAPKSDAEMIGKYPHLMEFHRAAMGGDYEDFAQWAWTRLIETDIRGRWQPGKLGFPAFLAQAIGWLASQWRRSQKRLARRERRYAESAPTTYDVTPRLEAGAELLRIGKKHPYALAYVVGTEGEETSITSFRQIGDPDLAKALGLMFKEERTRVLLEAYEEHKVPTFEEITIGTIVEAVKAYRKVTGKWPSQESGPVPGMPGKTWLQINQMLNRGSYGMCKPGNSLPKLLAEHFPERLVA